MSYNPNNPNGSATSANSAPVVIASDQAAVAVSSATLATNATLTGGTQQSKITDGTNVSAVKAASTAAAATDPSLVVNISPNSPAHPVTVSSGTVTTVSAVTAITNALPTGTNSIGTVQPGNTANTTPWLFRTAASTISSTLTFAKILSAASTNATSVKGTTGAIYGWTLGNTSASWRYVRIYNKATAPTVGTDSPAFVIPLPPGGGAVMAIGSTNIPLNIGFGYSITGAATDLDTTVVAANDVIGTIWYV